MGADPVSDTYADKELTREQIEAGNRAYRAVLAEHGYGGPRVSWPRPAVPAKVLNRAVKAAEAARDASV